MNIYTSTMASFEPAFEIIRTQQIVQAAHDETQYTLQTLQTGQNALRENVDMRFSRFEHVSLVPDTLLMKLMV